MGACLSDEWPEQVKMLSAATLDLWHKLSSKLMFQTWIVLPLSEVVATLLLPKEGTLSLTVF